MRDINIRTIYGVPGGRSRNTGKGMIAKSNGSVVLGHSLCGSDVADVSEPFSVFRISELDKPIVIRPYKKSDREHICRLCCETGFLGQPINSIFRDTDLFSELFTRPYLLHEPEWSMVIETDGKVIGYLLGSVSPRFEAFQMLNGFQTSMKMLFRLAAGRYARHPRSRKFIRWLFTTGMREQPKHPPRAAHLHWEIQKEYQGRGIAQRIWTIYEKRLRTAGMKTCYGAFFSHQARRPEAAYVRYGFKVYDRRPTTIFEPEIPGPVEVVCVSKSL